MDCISCSSNKCPSFGISLFSLQLWAFSIVMTNLLTFITSITSNYWYNSLVSHRCWCRCWEPTPLSKVTLSALIVTYPSSTIVMVITMITLWTAPYILPRGGSLGCSYCNCICLNYFMLLSQWPPNLYPGVSSNLPFVTPSHLKIILLYCGATTYFLVR